MKNKEGKNITLAPLEDSDIEQFVKDNQEAFKFGAIEEFGLRDDPDADELDEQFPAGMFRFEKIIK